MNTNWLKTRQTKYTAYVTVYILVILTIVVIANILAQRYNKTYDATSNKRYSLSEQTAKIVKGLKQDATITYFDQSSKFSSPVRRRRSLRRICSANTKTYRRKSMYPMSTPTRSPRWRVKLASKITEPQSSRSA